MQVRKRGCESEPKVALVRAPLHDASPLHTKKVECLGIASLASVVRHESLTDPILVDAELEEIGVAETLSTLRQLDPDVIGITVPLPHLPKEVMALTKELRDDHYDGWIVIGGHSPSFYSTLALELQPGFDAVFLGEAEVSFAAFLASLRAGTPFRGVTNVAYRERGEVVLIQSPCDTFNLDALPPLARDLTSRVIQKNGLVALSTSRACAHHCSFCSIGAFYTLSRGSHAWAARSPSSVAREVVDLNRHHGASQLLIVDEEFFGCGAGLDRAIHLARELEPHSLELEFAISCRASSIRPPVLRRLVHVGLRHIYIGVESGSANDLQLFEKAARVETNYRAVMQAQEAGVSVQVGTIVLHPWSTIEAIRDTFAFLRKVGHHGLLNQTTKWSPYHGTRLTEHLAQQGWLVQTDTVLSACYPQPWQQFLAAFFDELLRRFLHHYKTISRLQNARTFRWRGPVRSRTSIAADALSHFEHQLNDTTADLMEHALGELDRCRGNGVDPALVSAHLTEPMELAEEYLNLCAASTMRTLLREQDPMVDVQAWENLQHAAKD